MAELCHPRCRLLPALPTPVHSSLTPEMDGPADGDGFILADIDVIDGRIGRLAPSAARAMPLTLKGRTLPCFVDCRHPYRQGLHLAAQPQPRRLFMGALGANAADCGGALERAGRGAAHGFFRRMRSRPRHSGAAHAYRHDAAGGNLRLVFEEMRERRKAAASELQAAALAASSMCGMVGSSGWPGASPRTLAPSPDVDPTTCSTA